MELAKYACEEAEKWSSGKDHKGSPQVSALFACSGRGLDAGSWPAELKPKLCGVADFVMAEIMELSMNAFRDQAYALSSSACPMLCRQDAALLFRAAEEARNEAVPSGEEAVRDLLRRYQCFPLLLVGRAICSDEELGHRSTCGRCLLPEVSCQDHQHAAKRDRGLINQPP